MKRVYFLSIVLIILFLARIFFVSDFNFLSAFISLNLSENKFPLDDFAKCLSENEVKIYGTSWDGHTKNQKNLFGKSFKYLNYIECMSEEKGEMTSLCKSEEIKAFPTWTFPNGSRIIGESSLGKLSELSQCPIK